jgi:hypothetical protein
MGQVWGAACLWTTLAVVVVVHGQIHLTIPTNATINYETSADGDTVVLDLDDDDTQREPSPTVSMQIVRSFTWGSQDTPKDAKLEHTLTIKEGFFGAVHSVTPAKRVVRDVTCPVVKCPLCGGTTQVARDANGLEALKTSIVSPCPKCRALGVITESCQPFTEVPAEPVAVTFPPGVRPGHEVKLPGLGNPCFQDGDFAVGDLVVTVASVGTEEGYNVTKDGVLLTVTMTPDEALNGFVFEKAYVSDDEFLRIDRRGKVTVPGSTVRVPHLGFPVHVPADEAAKRAGGAGKSGSEAALVVEDSDEADAADAAAAARRDDLVIKFELEEEAADDKADDDDAAGADG